MSRPAPLVERLALALRGDGPTPGLGSAALIAALELLSYPQLSRLGGLIAQAKLPPSVLLPLLRWYIRRFDVDLTEVAEPLESFDTVDAFFTRKLHEGVHVIDPDPDVAICPVDGRALHFGGVADGQIEQVKGRSYRLAELLQSAADAERFADGHFVTMYLSPRDYHRIHCPVDGRIVRYRYVPGRLYPVNRFGVRFIDKLCAVNERLITYVESETLGEVAVVKVGATNVGMISASYTALRTNQGGRRPFDERIRPAREQGSTVCCAAARGPVLPRAARRAFATALRRQS